MATYDDGPSVGAASEPSRRPRPGEEAPDFALVNQFGEPVGTGTLGGGAHFLVFYPFAFSRVCTGELEALEELRPEAEAAGVRILAVSTDHKYALRAYAQELGLGFDLLSDFWPHGEVARRYGCFDEERGMATRSTFLVSGGRVEESFSSPVGEARRTADYRAALDRFRGTD